MVTKKQQDEDENDNVTREDLGKIQGRPRDRCDQERGRDEVEKRREKDGGCV